MSQPSSPSLGYPNPPAENETKFKITCVGDGGVGKTCLLIVYANNVFPTEYIPTVFENYTKTIPHGNTTYQVELWDTAGQEEYDRLRPLSYPDSDAIIICFSVNYPASLSNIEDKWYPEVSHFCPGVPIILVGTKIDLRTDARSIELLAAQGTKPISYETGAAFARTIGAHYREVAAVSGKGVEKVFELAIAESLRARRELLPERRRERRGRKCIVV